MSKSRFRKAVVAGTWVGFSYLIIFLFIFTYGGKTSITETLIISYAIGFISAFIIFMRILFDNSDEQQTPYI